MRSVERATLFGEQVQQQLGRLTTRGWVDSDLLAIMSNIEESSVESILSSLVVKS